MEKPNKQYCVVFDFDSDDVANPDFWFDTYEEASLLIEISIKSRNILNFSFVITEHIARG